MGAAGSGVPTEIPRLETLCRSSWITFVTENVGSEDRAAKLGRTIESHILRRWGEHFIDKITVPEVGNDQLNDVWREVQVMAGIDRPVTVHGIRHTFHDLARQQGVPDAVVKAMAGRAGTDVAACGQDKHLHDSRGVTVEEMRQASMALMELVPTEPTEVRKSRDPGRDQSGRGRNSDTERLAATAS
jgi:hypothetical protein